jgi:hypothetical protein
MNVTPVECADRSLLAVMGPTVRSVGADDSRPSGQEDR